MDKKKKGAITKTNILSFMNKNVANAKFTNDDMISLFRRLNIGEE